MSLCKLLVRLGWASLRARQLIGLILPVVALPKGAKASTAAFGPYAMQQHVG